jgi:hypothetical protein
MSGVTDVGHTRLEERIVWESLEGLQIKLGRSGRMIRSLSHIAMRSGRYVDSCTVRMSLLIKGNVDGSYG